MPFVLHENFLFTFLDNIRPSQETATLRSERVEPEEGKKKKKFRGTQANKLLHTLSAAEVIIAERVLLMF